MGNLPTWHRIKDISRQNCKKPVFTAQFVMQRFRFGALVSSAAGRVFGAARLHIS